MLEVIKQQKVWWEHFLWEEEVDRKTMKEVTILPPTRRSWVWTQLLTSVEQSKPSRLKRPLKIVTYGGFYALNQTLINTLNKRKNLQLWSQLSPVISSQLQSIYISHCNIIEMRKSNCQQPYISGMSALMRAILRQNYRLTPSGFIDPTVWVNHQR